MEQQRFFLLLALGLIMFMMWDAWQKDFGPKPEPTVATSAVSSAASSADVPDATDSVETTASSIPEYQAKKAVNTVKRVIINTDVLRVELDAMGGDVREVDLLKYPVEQKDPDKPFRLMNESNNNLFIAQSGFASKKASETTLTSAPNHTTIFSAEKNAYKLEDGKDVIEVPLSWVSPEGVEFVKTYVFKRGQYLVEVKHTINNRGDKPWRGNLYQQLQRKKPGDDGKKSNTFIHTYTGGVIYSEEEKYQKYNFDDMEDKDLDRKIKGGWAAMIQHYFLGAWIPAAKEEFAYYSRALDDERYILGMKSSSDYQVAANSSQTLQSRLFVGPKLQDQLGEIAPGLELTVDYGVLTFIAKPLFWLLETIHDFVGNWGWSIILLTLLIKLVFYKLSETSYKSMANMRKVQPKMQQIKERFGDDKQKMNQAMMELYRKEKINPLGGCLPILVQIPVFIALYWMLLESVEMRQAPWILWITDMSSADPYFILPVLMGITMLIQQKLNPAPMDPIQAKVMMMLPIVFTVFFAFFPSGLVLYWVANNMLSIAQQWYITRIVIKA